MVRSPTIFCTVLILTVQNSLAWLPSAGLDLQSDFLCQKKCPQHQFGALRSQRKNFVIVSALQIGLVGNSKADLATFLGIDSPAPPRTFEDGCRDNEREHTQECAGPPWNQFRRFVSYKDREASTIQWDSVRFYRNLIGKENAPFKTENLLSISKNPLLSRDECNAIILEAEKVAATHVGWDSRYTYGSSAREIQVDALPNSFKMLGSDLLPRRLLPAIEQAFPTCSAGRAVHLRVYSALVIKYDPDGGRAAMPAHQDFSFITLNIALNDLDEYAGGGTDVRALDRTIRIPRGHALTHAGALWHAGRAVSRGVRYVLAIFLHSRTHVDHGARFLQRSARLRAAGRLADAATECAFALRAAPTDPEALLQSGLLCAEQNSWAAAETCFFKALSLHPAGLAAIGEAAALPAGSAAAGSPEGGGATAAGAADNRLADTQGSGGTDPDGEGCAGPVSAEVLYNLGVARLRLGRPAAALRALMAAAAANPACERTQAALERVRAAVSDAR